jgi:DUF4097 and DUF4098 domain-containing protein YvlB
MSRKIFITCAALVIFFPFICAAKVEYKKQVNLTVPTGQAKSFNAATHNGNIDITAGKTADCNLIATITVKANSQDAAEKIADDVQISMIAENNNIIVKIEKPKVSNDVQISVDINANMPAAIKTFLESHNGNIDISGMFGGADGTTHNGNIDYSGAAADLKFQTHNGSVDVQCAGQSSVPCQISAQTHNGNIKFTAPENFSAVVSASTHNGSIKTSLPITVVGEVDKELNGTIGSGRDKLFLTTHNGSIKIK